MISYHNDTVLDERLELGNKTRDFAGDFKMNVDTLEKR